MGISGSTIAWSNYISIRADCTPQADELALLRRRVDDLRPIYALAPEALGWSYGVALRELLTLHRERGATIELLPRYEECIAAFRRSPRKDSADKAYYWFWVGELLIDYGWALERVARHEEARDAAREAIGMYAPLMRLTPQTTRAQLASAYELLARSCFVLDLSDQAYDAMAQTIRYAAMEPSYESEVRLALAAMVLAARTQEPRQMLGALKTSEHGPALARALARRAPEWVTDVLATALVKLCALYHARGELERARTVAEIAVEYCQRNAFGIRGAGARTWSARRRGSRPCAPSSTPNRDGAELVERAE